MKSYLIVTLILLFTFCNCGKRVKFTMQFWKGTNCKTASDGTSTCSIDNLEFYTMKEFDYGESDKNNICMNIPGLNKTTSDPDNLLWSHSEGLQNAVKNLSNWDEVLVNFCDTTVTPNMFKFRMYSDVGCLESNYAQEGEVPIGVYSPFTTSPYNYTEKITCEIYNSATKIYINAFWMIGLIAAILFF